MITSNYFSRYFAICITLLSLFIPNPSHAGSQAFIGVMSSIIPDKSCAEQPKNYEMTLVFDGEPENATFGWFYGKGTSSAEFKRISPTRFEVTYAVTRYYKLPPSIMELLPSRDGFSAVVRDHIPENNDVRESVCFFEKMEVNLKPINESVDGLIDRGKELLAADLILLEGSDLLWIHYDYKSAIEKARKVRPLYERIYGKWSKEALNASSVIIFALMKQDRFDEALEILSPYRKIMPDNETVKSVIKFLQEKKKEQDDLFRSDPDKKSDVDLEPLG